MVIQWPKEVLGAGSAMWSEIKLVKPIVILLLNHFQYSENNGQYVHSSTYRALTPYELVNPEEIKSCDEFDTAIKEKLDPAVSAKDFKSDPYIVAPTLDWYEDDEEQQTRMPEVDDITP